MMNLSRSNYEMWFLDLLEGRLSSAEAAEVRAFAEQHPDLQQELSEMEKAFGKLSVPPEADHFEHKEILHQYAAQEEDWPLLPLEVMPFSGKEALKKRIAPSGEELDLLLAAYVEGDLSESEQQQVLQLLNERPRLAAEVELLRQCKLQPEHLEFFGKSQLYQRSAGRLLPLVRRFAYAAAIVGLAVFFFNYPVSREAELAHSRTPQINSLSPVPTSSTDIDEVVEGHTAPRKRQALMQDRAIPESTFPEPLHDVAVLNEAESRDEPLVAQEVPGPDADESPLAEESMPEESTPAPLRDSDGRYQTLFEYAGSQARKRLWGDSNYPDEGFVMALAEREFQKRFVGSDQFVEVRRAKSEQDNEFVFRVGKFSYTRKK